MAFYWTKNIYGNPSPMEYATADGAIKVGDLLKKGTTAVEATVATAATESLIGVAMAQVADEASIAYMPVEGNVFIAQSVGTAYTDATHRKTYCDGSFTSGSMGVVPGTNTSTSNQILLLGLLDGETDGVVGNKVLCMINKGVVAWGD